MKNEFYRFRCEATEDPASAELLIFGPIGDWEDMGDVSAKGFSKALAALPSSVKRLDIHINSPGGSLFEASAIYSRLADHKSNKQVFIDGIAASAATIVAMVGHKIYVRANATMMVHMPSGIVIGNAKDMRQVATALDTVTESMINIYEKRTGQTRDDIRAMLDAETWLSPDDAVKHGFADEVRGVVKAAASLGENRYNFNGCEFDLSRFHNIPAFNATEAKPTETTHMEKPTAEGGGGTTKPAENPPVEKPVTAPPTDPPKPPVQPAASAKSYDDGISTERARVSALQELDRPETHEIVAEAIKNGKTATEIFPQIMAAMDKARTRQARHLDAGELDRIPATGGGEGENGFAALLTQKVQEKAKVRNRSMRSFSRN